MTEEGSQMSRGVALPELSTGAWLATLLAGLASLILGFYPVVAYPTIARFSVQAQPSAYIALLHSRGLSLAFSALTVLLLARALTGNRSGALRNRLAYASLITGVAGLTCVLIGIYALRP